MPARPAQKIRVGFFENGAGFGGAVTCLEALIRALDKERFEAFVFSSHADDATRAAIARAGGRFLHVRQYRRPRWLTASVRSLARWPRLARYPLLVVVLFFETLARLFRGCLARRHLTRHGIHVVHLNNSAASNVDGIVAARLARLPCLLHARGYEEDAPETRAAVRWIDRFVAMSESVATGLTRLRVPRERIQVVYEGIDLRQVEARGAEPLGTELVFGRHNVGMVGMLIPWKGQRVFLEAVALLAQESVAKDCRFFVVGGAVPGCEDYRAGLERLVRDRGLAERVTFTGHRDNVFNLVRRLDVVVHASTSPEPFGRVILEAMALGRPVIATRMGGPLELVEHDRDGVLVAPGDPAELAAAIRGLLADAERRRRIGAAAVQTVAGRFTEERFAGQMADVYADACRNARVSGGARPVTTGPRES